MGWKRNTALALLGATLAWTTAARAAMFEGRAIDDHWWDGRAVSDTWGAYHCQIKFHGDRVFFRLVDAGIEVVGVLDDEIIVDPHDILVHDPKRGGDWSLDCYDLGP